jgi:hypothetical protein
VTDVTIKVERTFFPPGKPALVNSRYGMICNRRVHLSDDIRWQMGGDRVGYFQAVASDDGKALEIKTRIPDESW